MTKQLRLKLADFTYADLFDAARLPHLDAEFLRFLARRDSGLALRFRAYRDGESIEARALSELLIDVARHLEDFLVDAFRIEAARDALRAATTEDAAVHAFKDRFAKRRAGRAASEQQTFDELDAQLALELDAVSVADRELAVARFWQRAERAGDMRRLELLDAWVRAALGTEAGRHATRGWVSLRFPRRTDYAVLVPVEVEVTQGATCLEGRTGMRRNRDGFELTDPRCSRREALDQVYYCKYCHTHEGDVCARGFRAKGSEELRTNPLGVPLTGCPLHERISEANVLQAEGQTLAALAVIMIDNPLVPATGHRICNDCMKSCIYQKQEPVNVPQIETRILNDVLELPWGYEIYYCLTRWNPLNRERPYARTYHGVNVLCVGVGPAGFTLAQHLLQAGFGVTAIDGLKIEPLPEEWVGSKGGAPEPIERIEVLRESLDERTVSGFGGVAEYGITVRWDKNFLRILHLTLSRNRHFRVYGGIRFGGTMTVDDAWNLGFDHIALATGAGRPTIVPVGNGLAHGIRQASDFLMALQLTGAAKRSSLANLQVRLPALVIGGGLTAIDTATEVQAYYIRQVEKLLERCERIGVEGVRESLTEAERGVLDQYLDHALEVRAERERAQRVGEAPDFAALVRRWGGVTVVYRRRLAQSPAYLRNHEEIEKALEEGIRFVECLTPEDAMLDEHGHVAAMRFRSTAARESEVDCPITLAARSVFMAAGSSPNTAYEREHPGTFEMDGSYYALPRVETVEAASPTPRFFTSYRDGARRISVFGDNHPDYSGSVVRAMASGRDGAREIERLFAARIEKAGVAPAQVHACRWNALADMLDDQLRPRVVSVRSIGAQLVSITVRAPQATRNWSPGQVYRLQNFESRAERRGATRLQMEGMAVDGVHVDRDTGEVRLLVREVGTSSRIAARLRPDEPVVLMGPTGSALPVAANSTVTVIGNHAALTSAIDGGKVWSAAGSRVIVIGHLRDREHMDAVGPLVREIADRIIWVLDQDPPGNPIRPQDICFTGGLGPFLERCGALPETVGAWLRETDELILSDKPEEMSKLVDALQSELSSLVKPNLRGTAVVTAPMQCMLKEICAQCVCQRRAVVAGAGSSVVFSCFNQHQPLFEVDLVNLGARQGQNSVQEKVGALWLDRLLGGDTPVSTPTDTASSR